MKKLLFTASFLMVLPFFLIFCAILLTYTSYSRPQKLSLFPQASAHDFVSYGALPSSENIFSQEITEKDARSELIRQFFARYNSPLEPYVDNIIKAAAQYGIDYRLVPAIAMQESNLCLKAPKDSYNCWGFGIYDKQVKRFSGYPEAIETVTKTLAQEYKNKGFQSPEEIMTKYTPSSNGSWAHGVNEFMNQLQ